MATTIDPNGSYTVSGQAILDCITQSGYVQSALTALETAHPNYVLFTVHKPLNHLSLIAANAFGFDSDTFKGNGSVTGTTPSSGGTDKTN